ncbi:MAG: PIG-L family deacetylase, partial [Victivallales bacterium]|nr:PIG-L family deacetylase [Victivallales bacterium]
MSKVVFAAVAHPDDIEFMMSGTMLLLRDAGCELHYMNIANGDCGTAEHDKVTIARIRRGESMAAAEYMGAHYHESLVSDLEVFYDLPTLSRMTAVMRDIKPDILLVQYPFDYMEDHCNSTKLAVSAAFNRGMVNAPSEPPRPTFDHPVAVYHALPHGLHDPL